MPGAERPTLKAIATLAGVSEATVSRVLRNMGPVADETRRKVLDAFRALGGGAPRPIIGILVPDPSNQYFARLTVHLQTVFLRRGYLPVMLATGLVQGIHPIAVDLLVATNVVGVVHAAVDHMDHGVIADIARRHLPTVLFARVRSSGNADFIEVDSSTGMLDALRHLYDLGHEHIAFIEGLPESQTANERLLSFRAAADELGFTVRRFEGDYTFEAGIAAARQIIHEQASQRPTAVVAANDMAAFGAIQAFGGGGVNVPGDISVIGYDNTPFSRWTHPSLASVAPHRSALADLAAALLLKRIERVAQVASGNWPQPSYHTVAALYHHEGRTSVGPAAR